MSMVFEVNTRGLDKKFGLINTEITKGMVSDGDQAARKTAFFMMRSTLPFSGKDPWPFEPMKGRIRDDVEKAYSTPDEEGWEPRAFDIIKEEKGEKAALKWWRLFKANPIDSEDLALSGQGGIDILGAHKTAFDKMGGFRMVSEAKYGALRDKFTTASSPKRLKVAKSKSNPNGTPTIGFLTLEKREAFIKRRQLTMGLAKAGWLAVAQGLGRVKATVGKDGDSRFVWPKQLRKAFNKFGGMALGSADVMVNKDGYRFRIRNKVHYAGDEDVLPENLKDLAFSLGRKEMIHQTNMRYKNNKKWRGAH